MKVDSMRRIDYWVGVPLIALVSAGYRLWRALRRAPPPVPAAGDILFIELSEMGSTILADPAMRRAQALFPDARLHFLTFASNRASLAIMGTIPDQRVLVIRSDNFVSLAIDSIRAILRMRAMKLAVVYDLELFSRYSGLLTFLSGGRVRVGFHRFHNEGLYRGNLLTHPVAYNPTQHIAKNFLAMVYATTEAPDVVPHTKRAVGDDEIRLAPYQPDPQRLAALRTRLRATHPVLARVERWVILNPNSSEMLPLRRWPPAYYVELARRLLDDPTVALLITGIAAEKPEARALIDACRDERVVDLTGATTLEELPLLYCLCTAMVTNDSGPAHFAAATRLKTIVLFGPETPDLYGCLNEQAEFAYARLACSPCVSAANHRKSACTDAQCLKDIPPDSVYRRLAAHLAAKAIL